MSKSRMYSNARTTARWHCDDTPMTWDRIGKQGRRNGWLRDISSDGIVYLMPKDKLPSIGDEVIVTPRGGNTVRGLVVRLGQAEQDLAIVGCQFKAASGKFSDILTQLIRKSSDVPIIMLNFVENSDHVTASIR